MAADQRLQGRLLVVETTWDAATAFGQRVVDEERRGLRRTATAAAYTLEELHLAPDDDLRLGDVLVEKVLPRTSTKGDDKVRVHPPAVVVRGPEPIPRSRGRRLVVTRRRADLAAYPLGIVVAGFRAARLRIPDPLAPGEVTSRRHREVLLDLWALEDLAEA